LKLLLKSFHFWEFFNLGRLPMRIRPPEKSLCFSTFFEYAFKPSIIIFRASSSPHLLSSAPLSTWPSKVVRFLTLPLFWMRLRALTSFEHDFEPSLPFERAFEPSTILLSAPLSPRFPSSAPLSPHIFSSTPVSPRFLSHAPSSPRSSFWVRLRALIQTWISILFSHFRFY